MANENVTPPELKYSAEHTWLRIESDGKGRVGFTNYGLKKLGQLVYLELPEPGRKVLFMQPCGGVEAGKAASDLYSPVSGKVVEVNEALNADPSIANCDPYERGWMMIVELANPDDIEKLMSAEEYDSLTRELSQ